MGSELRWPELDKELDDIKLEKVYWEGLEKKYPKEADPLESQIGGDHYKKFKIQPATYAHQNQLGFLEGSIIKYITRWKLKNGLVDLYKAKHILEILISEEEKKLNVDTP